MLLSCTHLYVWYVLCCTEIEYATTVYAFPMYYRVRISDDVGMLLPGELYIVCGAWY